MSENVWTAPVDEGAPAPAVLAVPEGELPPVVGLLTACIDDIKAAFGDHLLAGLGPLLLLLPVVFLGMGLMFGGMVPGIVADDPLLMMGGMIGGMVLYLGAVVLVTAPLNASVTRAVHLHLKGEGKLGFGAAFSTVFQDIGTVLLLSTVLFALVLGGMLFCYVPGLLVSLFTSFALPAVVVHRLSAFEALGLSVRHARANLSWHLGFWGLGLAILIVSQNVPFIGPMLGTPLYAAYHLRAYHHIFGTGERPREA